MFLLAILIAACAYSRPAFLMMYSAYKLNKHGDNIQPWRTPFLIIFKNNSKTIFYGLYLIHSTEKKNLNLNYFVE